MRFKILNKYVLVLLVLIIQGLLVHAQNRVELEKKKSNTLKEIDETTAILKEVSKGKSSSINRLVIINRQIRNRKRLMGQLNQEIIYLNIRIGDNEYVIKSMGEDVKRMKNDYASLIIAAYKHKPPYSELTYVLASKSINQAYRRLKYMKQYAEYRKKQVYLINQIQDLLETINKELLLQKREKNNLLIEYQIVKNALDKEVLQQQGLVKNLRQQEKEIKRKLAKQRRLARKLDKEIRNLIEKEMKKKGEALCSYQ